MYIFTQCSNTSISVKYIRDLHNYRPCTANNETFCVRETSSCRGPPRPTQRRALQIMCIYLYVRYVAHHLICFTSEPSGKRHILQANTNRPRTRLVREARTAVNKVAGCVQRMACFVYNFYRKVQVFWDVAPCWLVNLSTLRRTAVSSSLVLYRAT